MDDWSNIAYLSQGTERQQSAYRALLTADIFTVLAEYDPVLVGSIPLDIDIAVSDLDILIQAKDFDRLTADLEAYYAHMPNFELVHRTWQDRPTLICRFLQDAFTIEIFAQALAVEEQDAYRHLVVQGRLLRLSSDEAHKAIRALKHEGHNTEAAFCRYFLIPGEPRAALLELYHASYNELEEIIWQAAHNRDPFSVPEL